MSDCKHPFPGGGTEGVLWYRTTCNYGNCFVEACALDDTILASFGPVECPCDHFPGWKAYRLAEMSRPHPPIKAVGRHGSRVQRSRRRHTFNPRTLEIFASLRASTQDLQGRGAREEVA